MMPLLVLLLPPPLMAELLAGAAMPRYAVRHCCHADCHDAMPPPLLPPPPCFAFDAAIFSLSYYYFFISIRHCFLAITPRFHFSLIFIIDAFSFSRLLLSACLPPLMPLPAFRQRCRHAMIILPPCRRLPRRCAASCSLTRKLPFHYFSLPPALAIFAISPLIFASPPLFSMPLRDATLPCLFSLFRHFAIAAAFAG